MLQIRSEKPAVLSLVPLYLNNQFDLLTNWVFFFNECVEWRQYSMIYNFHHVCRALWYIICTIVIQLSDLKLKFSEFFWIFKSASALVASMFVEVFIPLPPWIPLQLWFSGVAGVNTSHLTCHRFKSLSLPPPSFIKAVLSLATMKSALWMEDIDLLLNDCPPFIELFFIAGSDSMAFMDWMGGMKWAGIVGTFDKCL